MLYEIYKVEEVPFANGTKVRKQMVLQGDGQQNTEERVTLWSNHPDYVGAVVGAKFDWVMKKEDSGNPIPAHPEKNYVNRSIAMPNEIVQPKAQPNVTELAIKTHVSQEIAPVREALRAIVEHLGVETPTAKIGNTDVDYPEETEDNMGEIKPDDVEANPF